MAVSYDFTGRTAVVTGASKGIGRRIAERLRDAGAQVWNFDQSPTLIDRIGEIRVDVTDAGQIADAVAQLQEKTSRLGILVNNAGFTGGSLTVEELDPADWRRGEPHRRVRGHSSCRSGDEAWRLRTDRQRRVTRRKGWFAEPLCLFRSEGRCHRLHEVAGQGIGGYQHPSERRRPGSGRDRHPPADGSRVCAGLDARSP